MVIKDNKIEFTDEENENVGKFIELFKVMMRVQQLSESLHKTIMSYIETFEEKDIVTIKRNPEDVNIAQLKLNFAGIINNIDYINTELDNMEKEVKDGIELYEKLHPIPFGGIMPPNLTKNDKGNQHSGIILPN